MPVFRPDDLLRASSDGKNSVTGAFSALRLGDTGGLTQFGVVVETLPPGSRSSIKHWHSDQDELVYMLSGSLTLHEGDSETDIHPGDTATFKAGDALGHCLENKGQSDATFLVVGARSDRDTVTYPDDDRILICDYTTDSTSWTTHDGAPASNPYKPG